MFANVLGRKKKLTRTPLPRGRALNLGSKYVDRTPAATFGLKKSARRVKAVDDFSTWRKLEDKFRPPIRHERTILGKRKVFKGKDVFIERQRFRIDSPGEVRGLAEAKRAGGFRKKSFVRTSTWDV